MSHPSSIGTGGFDCELAEGQYDYDHILGSWKVHQTLSSLAPLSHHIAMAKLASVIRSHVEESDKSPDTLLNTLSRLDELEQQGLFVADDALGLPEWALGQRSHYYFTLNHTRLKLCRAMFRPGIEKFTGYEQIRNYALSAATAISDTTDFPLIYRKTWFVSSSYHLFSSLLPNQVSFRIFASANIAAGVFLALDLLSGKHAEDAVAVNRQKMRIASCKSAIAPFSGKTTICRGGCRILDRLIELINVDDSNSEEMDLMQLIIDMDIAGVASPEGSSPRNHPQTPYPVSDTAAQMDGLSFDENDPFWSWSRLDDWTIWGSGYMV